MRTIPQAALDLIKRNEGCVLHAYRDIVNVLSIGYGHTLHVYEGQTITQAEADALLASDLQAEFVPGVLAACGTHPTTDNQLGALVSLAYNVGVGGEAHSTVQRLHNAGNYQEASSAFLMWDKAGGKVVPALLRRRGEEASLYLTPGGESPPASIETGQSFTPHEASHLSPAARSLPKSATPEEADNAVAEALTRSANPGVFGNNC